MNWFQIVFLREQSQVTFETDVKSESCELISNCIFTWAITSSSTRSCMLEQLWIDFKLYFYVSNHKIIASATSIVLVVNWFQIVFLREQSQERMKRSDYKTCCELISNCIFTWAITSGSSLFYNPFTVVNWFQIVFLREQSQVVSNIWKTWVSCELISNCIFTWAITRTDFLMLIAGVLWIDFKLYFYVSNHKVIEEAYWLNLVVNWFQIVFLREQSQVITNIKIVGRRCELISNCIFTWAITSSVTVQRMSTGVVNWFQIVFLREQSQAFKYTPAKPLCCELISNCIFTWAITRSIPKYWVITIVWDCFIELGKLIIL